MHDLLQLEPRTLPHELPRGFEQFYRASLRRVMGRRLRSNVVKQAYDEWARDNDAAGMTYSQLRAAFELAGHRRVQSNGVNYDNLAFAADYPGVADTLRTPIMTTAPTADFSAVVGSKGVHSVDAIAKVDRALAALLDVRTMLLAERDQRDPAEAARRVLGLDR